MRVAWALNVPFFSGSITIPPFLYFFTLPPHFIWSGGETGGFIAISASFFICVRSILSMSSASCMAYAVIILRMAASLGASNGLSMMVLTIAFMSRSRFSLRCAILLPSFFIRLEYTRVPTGSSMGMPPFSCDGPLAMKLCPLGSITAS